MISNVTSERNHNGTRNFHNCKNSLSTTHYVIRQIRNVKLEKELLLFFLNYYKTVE